MWVEIILENKNRCDGCLLLNYDDAGEWFDCRLGFPTDDLDSRSKIKRPDGCKIWFKDKKDPLDHERPGGPFLPQDGRSPKARRGGGG